LDKLKNKRRQLVRQIEGEAEVLATMKCFGRREIGKDRNGKEATSSASVYSAHYRRTVKQHYE